jgi:hypothetical protein
MRASILQEAGGCESGVHYGGRKNRISENFGYLSKPLSFVFREVQSVLLPKFGDLIRRVCVVQRRVHSSGEAPGSIASLSFAEASDDILF